MSIFALVDCNNFYVSCERVFDPYLAKKPIIVLSNNDGCVISRSNEAKSLGVPMGAPFYKYREIIEKNNIEVYSSNYQFYGDMSQRVMKSLGMIIPKQDIEIYSIDEAFIRLDGYERPDVIDLSIEIKKNILNWTGIPISVGIAQTKTLSKVANHIAKKNTSTGVFDIRNNKLQEQILSNFQIEDLWGISYRWGKKLRKLGINNGLDLRNSDTKFIRKKFNIVLERMVYELRGIPCLDIEKVTNKKSIMSSRSFGKLVTELESLEQAISTYATIACEKLRHQNSKSQGIYVFLQTNRFRKDLPQYRRSMKYKLDLPTSDTGYIINAGKKILKKIYRKGYHYQKCGIMLFDLSSKYIQQENLFVKSNQSNEHLMESLDTINKVMGSDTVFFAAKGTQNNWKMRRNKLSSRYTTNWMELPKVY